MVPHAASGRRMVWWLGSPVALLAAGWLAGLRLNLTGSLPVGLYVASGGRPARGALVLACLPPRVAEFARARGYVPRGGACPGGVVPVGKSILAVPGDTVTVTLMDRKGRPLPGLAISRYVVGPGELWLLSSYSPWSFDSRYFGAVKVGQVRAKLWRLWTVGR